MRALPIAGLFGLIASVCNATEAGISSRVIVTAQGGELFQTWESNPPGGFSILPVKVAKRGEFLSAVVLFEDCAAGPDGNCNAVLDITTYDPSGKVYGQFAGEELWIGKPGPTGYSQLAVGYMGLVIEASDPAGEYKVVATARDLVSGKSSTSEAIFTVQ